MPSVDRRIQTLVLADVELSARPTTSATTRCYTRHLPSAKASQAIAKCRKQHGHVRKTEKAEPKRWQRKVEGQDHRHAMRPPGQEREYCRPSKHVSSKTPKCIRC